MTEYIKLDSDRPDWDQVVEHLDGSAVDLTDADNVQLFMWDGEANLLINDSAEIVTPHVGEVRYDFDRTQIARVGTNFIELRVDWGDGDRQWFPTTESAYEMEVVAPGGDRTVTLDETAIPDADISTLTIHDGVITDPGTLELRQSDVHITDGDLTIDGELIGAEADIVLEDDESIDYGSDDDFGALYNSTADVYQIHNNISDIPVLRLSKGGALTVPNGDIEGGSTTVFDEANSWVPTAALESDTVTVAGNDVTLGDAVALAHADLDAVASDDHHTKYTDSEATSAVEDASSLTLSGDLTINDTLDVTGAVALSDALDVGGDLTHDGTTTLYDATNAWVPVSVLEEDTVTVAGNSVALGASTQIDHVDLASIASNDHHAKYTDAEALAAAEAETTFEHAGNVDINGDLVLTDNTIVGEDPGKHIAFETDWLALYGDDTDGTVSIQTGDVGSASVKLRDGANSQDLLDAAVGGPVDVPNTELHEQGSRVASRTWVNNNFGSGGSGIEIRHDGSTILTGPTALDFTTNLDAVDAGSDVVEVTASGGSGGSHAVSDAGTEVTSEVADLNLGTNLDVTDDGSGDVTIDHDGSADTVDGYEGSDLAALAEAETVTAAWSFDSTPDVSGDDVLTTADQSVVTDTTVTLSSGTATVSTGVSSGHIDVSLDPSGGGANSSDVKVAARAVWNSGAGEYEVEVVEDGTDVGNPDVGVKVVQN